MTDEREKGPSVIPNIVHIMDIAAFIENLRDEMSEMAHFSFTIQKGEPTVAFSLPNSISEDFNSKCKVMGDLSYLLLEQVAKRGNYKSIECEDEDKHSKWDVNIR